MKQIKDNLPLVLLLSIVPYFFYNEASIAQAIIAGSLAALVGFKYYLEQKALPDYRELCEELISEHKEAVEAKLKAQDSDIDIIRQKQGLIGLTEARQQQREKISW